MLVVVSIPYEYGAHHHNDNKKPALQYNKSIIPRFDKCIDIMNSKDKENKMSDIKIRNGNNIIGINNFHNGKLPKLVFDC